MSEAPTVPDEPVIWVVAGLVVAGLGLAEWAVSAGPDRAAPLPEAGDGGGPDVRNLYGLTPVDVALVADRLAGRSPETGDDPYVVAGYPGPDRLNGPLLTRSSADRQLAQEDGDRLDGRAVGDGWRQLTVANRDAPRRDPLLAGARVSVESDGGGRRVCPRLQLERFACAPPGWSHVRRKDVGVDGTDTSCIWSHPLENKRTVIDFGPVGARTDGPPYRVRTALDDDVADEPGAVDVDIHVGDRVVEHRHRAEKGWQESPPLEIDGAEPVRVVVSAERVGRRHFCFRID